MFSLVEPPRHEPRSRPSPLYRASPMLAPMHVCESRRQRKRWGDIEQQDLLISKVLGADPQYRRNCQRIIDRQARLKRSVSKAAWALYLSLEEAEVQRLSCALDLIAKVALARGRRSRAR